MNAIEIKLKESQTTALNNINTSLDDLRVAVDGNDNYLQLKEIDNSINSMVEQLFELNKTMTNIAESLRVIKFKK
jgi:hypothetical protein